MKYNMCNGSSVLCISALRQSACGSNYTPIRFQNQHIVHDGPGVVDRQVRAMLYATLAVSKVRLTVGG